MPNSPDDKRNRRGCLIIAALALLFAILYVIVGFGTGPAHKPASKIAVEQSGQQ